MATMQSVLKSHSCRLSYSPRGQRRERQPTALDGEADRGTRQAAGLHLLVRPCSGASGRLHRSRAVAYNGPEAILPGCVTNERRMKCIPHGLAQGQRGARGRRRGRVNPIRAREGQSLADRIESVGKEEHRTQAEAPKQPDPDNSTVLSLALGNLLD